ncbi:MAG: hypothetical protein KDA44_22645 [Planctomycetales bacterium]|nr:hypothetical protein [Planctomycetales bacterium]
MNPPHLPKLPSVQELLDHPRVKGVVQRLNQSTLAQRAGSFLDDVRDSVAKRAGEWEMPSVGQIAERFARRVFGETPGGAAWINATGVVVGAAELTPPLPDSALHALIQSGGDYTVDANRGHSAATAALSDLHRGYDVAVLASVDAALLLATMAMAAGGRVGVLPGAAGATSRNDWPKLGARAGAILNEFSGQDAAGLAAVIRPPEAACDAATDLEWPTPDGVTRIDVAPLAGSLDPAEIALPAMPTIAARLASGAQLVIADGAGLLAGPSCGVVVGVPACIAALTSHPLFEVLRASGLVCAALRTTLIETRRADRAALQLALPTWQLISAPLENLRQRAERLSQLMAEAPAIAAATVVESAGAWGYAGGRALSAPTCAIVLTPKNRAVADVHDALQHAARPVAARLESEQVLVDLRSVFPRWDQELVASVESLS